MGTSLTSAFYRNKTNRPRKRLLRSIHKSYQNPQINYYARFLAKHPTKAEMRFYDILRSMKLHKGLLFQSVIFNYIIDFLLPKHRIAIEIDGSSHNNKKQYDDLRTKTLNESNVIVLRFKNEEVFNNSKDIIDRLNQVLKIRKKEKRNRLFPKVKIYLSNQYSQEELKKLISTKSSLGGC